MSLTEEVTFDHDCEDGCTLVDCVRGSGDNPDVYRYRCETCGSEWSLSTY